MCKVCRRRYTQHRARAYTRRELESDSSYIRLYNTFVHCTHIDVCAREIEYAHTNENSCVRSPVRSFGLFVCRSLALARTRSCINTHTIHRTLLYHNFINIIIAQFACIPCPCATQKSTECSIGISSIKYIHNNFFNFSLCGCFAAKFFFDTNLFIYFFHLSSIWCCRRHRWKRSTFMDYIFFQRSVNWLRIGILCVFCCVCVFRVYDYDQSN